MFRNNNQDELIVDVVADYEVWGDCVDLVEFKVFMDGGLVSLPKSEVDELEYNTWEAACRKSKEKDVDFL